jgi:hypothetical protein
MGKQFPKHPPRRDLNFKPMKSTTLLRYFSIPRAKHLNLIACRINGLDEEEKRSSRSFSKAFFPPSVAFNSVSLFFPSFWAWTWCGKEVELLVNLTDWLAARSIH